MIELPKTIDELEDAVEEMDVPHTQLILEFRNFINNLIVENRLPDIANEKMKLLSKYLGRDAVLMAQKDEKIQSQFNLELAYLANENQGDHRYYSLLRCLRLIYVDKPEWERVAQDTLLFTFFFHLQRMLNDIEPEFIRYFSSALFHK